MRALQSKVHGSHVRVIGHQEVAMLDVQQILTLHRQAVVDWHDDPVQLESLSTLGEATAAADEPSGVSRLILEQHAFNYRLWHQEDHARCPHASDEQIARVKRAIDGLNQQRNDWIEKLDVWIAKDLDAKSIPLDAQARQNTETPGSAVDRLSIMALRLYHLAEQLDRTDAGDELLASVREKIDRGQRQLSDLSQSLTELLDDIYAGRKRHALYCQMKMYNDPRLNPYLVAAEKSLAG